MPGPTGNLLLDALSPELRDAMVCALPRSRSAWPHLAARTGRDAGACVLPVHGRSVAGGDDGGGRKRGGGADRARGRGGRDAAAGADADAVAIVHPDAGIGAADSAG